MQPLITNGHPFDLMRESELLTSADNSTHPGGMRLADAVDAFENVKSFYSQVGFTFGSVLGDGTIIYDGDQVTGSCVARRYVDVNNMFARKFVANTQKYSAGGDQHAGATLALTLDFSNVKIKPNPTPKSAIDLVHPFFTESLMSTVATVNAIYDPANTGTAVSIGIPWISPPKWPTEFEVEAQGQTVYYVKYNVLDGYITERYDGISVDKLQCKVGDYINITIPAFDTRTLGHQRWAFTHVKKLRFGKAETSDFMFFSYPTDAGNATHAKAGIRVKVPIGATTGPIEFFASYDPNNLDDPAKQDYYYTRFDLKII